MKISEQLEIAENLDAKAEELAEIAKSEKSIVRQKVAKHPNCPITVQNYLSLDDDEQVRINLGQNINLTEQVQIKLLQDSDEVKKFLAYNPRLVSGIFDILSEDTNKYIRSGIARNINCPIRLMSKLAKDEEEIVIEGIAENISTPVDLLGIIFDTGYATKSLASNPNTPIDILTELSEDSFDEIRESVAGNPSTPIEILEILIDDENLNVKNYAQENLDTRK